MGIVPDTDDQLILSSGEDKWHRPLGRYWNAALPATRAVEAINSWLARSATR
ncbi:MAG: hypothetical protein AAGA12_00850 [Pseudomonadota bacterium]